MALLAQVNLFLNTVGAKAVSSGAPIWPGNTGAVQRIGRMPLNLYQYLDGNGDYIQFSDPVDNIAPFSVCAWVKPNQLPPNNTLA